MRRSAHGRGRGRLLLATSTMAGLAGAACIGAALAGQQTAPQPPAAGARAPVTTGSVPSRSRSLVLPRGTPSGSNLGPTTGAGSLAVRSLPSRISIPAIGVQAGFVRLGLNPDGSIGVPSDVTHVGWYQRGPAPGQVGPAVVLGHIDSATAGPGVFFRLGALRSGDQVHISLRDGRRLTFAVYAVREYPKNQFPTLTVYGNTSDPQLRLITCGGTFDRETGHYRSNVVVFAREISSSS